MVDVFFHDLASGKNEEKSLYSLPRIGDTLAFAPSNSFYLVKGVTQNVFDPSKNMKETFEYEVYAIPISQSDWIKTLR